MPPKAAGIMPQGSEGGVWHGFWLRCTTAVFVYLTHSAVVSQFEKAIHASQGPHDG